MKQSAVAALLACVVAVLIIGTVEVFDSEAPTGAFVSASPSFDAPGINGEAALSVAPTESPSSEPYWYSEPEPEPSYSEPKPADPPDAYYKNCAAVRAAGAAPLYRGDPGYGSHLDRDGDGTACE